MEKFEAVVIGCGPAGAAAALELAKNGVQTLVLERARTPGGKNATGGILYGTLDTPYNLDYVLPAFEKEAPLERRVTRYILHTLGEGKVRSLDLTRLHEHNTAYAWTVLRAKFDDWLSQKVHEATRRVGGGLLSSVRAMGPYMEDGRIAGVQTSELEPIRADVVIAADGATSEMVRAAGLRDWMRPAQWFQGVKVVVAMPAAALENRFQVHKNEGVAHLFAGDLFGGARGGGFLYTNNDTLSIGTVFHLDSVVAAGVEPHHYLDQLLTHPLLREWLGGDYEELEYSAKLIPDGKKAFLDKPYKDCLLAVGDAANHMQAAGPIIKGMNFGITAGIIAARAYVSAKQRGQQQRVGEIYAQELQASNVRQALQGNRMLKQVMGALTAVGENFVPASILSCAMRSSFVAQQVESMFGSYALSEAAPDRPFVYNTLPALLAKHHGKSLSSLKELKPLSLDDRIAKLAYDTDIGRPHIEVLDDSPEASGACVTACPVSAKDSSRGCYRLEEHKLDGQVLRKVALDTQPCVECGTCAVVGKTQWEHPRGGKGVEYKYG